MQRTNLPRRLGVILSTIWLAILPLAAAGSAAAAPAPLPQTSASTIAACLRSGQVWVLVVDDQGRTLVDRCAGRSGTGEEVLRSVAGVDERKIGPSGFVCQINEYPGTCIEGSQFRGEYWNYYHGLPSAGRWEYSQKGYREYQPSASIEAWCYGTTDHCAGGAPFAGRVNLQQVAKALQAPSPRPTAAPTSARPLPSAQPTSPGRTDPGRRTPGKHRPAPSARPSASQRPSPSATPSSTRTPTPSATPTAPSPTPTPSRSPSASPTPSGTTSTAVRPASSETPVAREPVPATPSGQGGTPWGTIATVGTAGSIGAAAAITMLVGRRRQRRETDGTDDFA